MSLAEEPTRLTATLRELLKMEGKGTLHTNTRQLMEPAQPSAARGVCGQQLQCRVEAPRSRLP